MDAKLLVHIEVLCRLVLAHRICHFLTHQKSTTFEKINTWVKKRIAFVKKSIFGINKDKIYFLTNKVLNVRMKIMPTCCII